MPIAKKADTKSRIKRRNYEERHKEERKNATKHFDTLLKTEELDEINAFLKKHGLTKAELVREGFETLKVLYGPKGQANSE